MTAVHSTNATDSAHVTIEVTDGVAVLRMNAPPLNLLSQSLRQEITAAFIAAAADMTVRAIVLTGDSNFCAGADLKEFAARQDPEVAAQHVRTGHAMTRAIIACDKPVIAAVEGACLGGGLELALCCDLRVAARDVKLGLPEIRRGVFPGTGGIFLLERLIGPSQAKLIVLQGNILTADSAAAGILVNHFTQPGKALEAALALAQDMAARSGPALQAAKRLLDRGLRLELERHLAAEHDEYIACYGRQDPREGWQAFLEKRPPVWAHC